MKSPFTINSTIGLADFFGVSHKHMRTLISHMVGSGLITATSSKHGTTFCITSRGIEVLHFKSHNVEDFAAIAKIVHNPLAIALLHVFHNMNKK